jgi:quinol monooxygenase YgiN
MIIIAITSMSVLPEKQKEVLQTLLSMVEPPRKEKGCLSYGIFCDIEDKNVFNLISEWETRQHLDHHMKSDRFGVLLGIKSLLIEPLKIQIVTASESEGIEAVNSIREKKKLVSPNGYRQAFGRVSIDYETDIFSEKLLPADQNFTEGLKDA